MRPADPNRSAPSWAGAFLTLLAWALADTRSVRAECSPHYAPIVSLSVGSRAPDLGRREVPDGARDLPGRPRPCTGEMCSGRPAVPLSPAPPEIPPAAS